MLVTLPNPHPEALARPFTPKVLRAKECVLALYSSVVFASDSHLSLLLENVSIIHIKRKFEMS
jgi:hypothetical protein